MPSTDAGRRWAGDALFGVLFAAIRAFAHLVKPVSKWTWKARSALARARWVQERRAFALAELRGTGEPACYHLRSGGTALCLRHGTGDQYVFDEIFEEGLYEFPPPVLEALRRMGPDLKAVDLGGHVGLFGTFLRSRYPDARITAFEPDPGSYGVLQTAIAKNGAGDGWTAVQACALNRDDTVDFTPGENCLSRLEGASARGTIRMPAVDVFPYLQGADLLKIDIEGSEWAILADRRFAELDAPVAVLEYHPHLAPEPDAHAAAVTLLERGGYETSLIFHAPEGHGMLWAWKP